MKPTTPTFPDYVAINALDTLKDPTYPTMKVLNFIFFKEKTICNKCHDYKTFKLIKDPIKGDCFTIKCRCGVDIIYPKSKRRNNCRLWVNIPKEQYRGDIIEKRNNNGTNT